MRTMDPTVEQARTEEDERIVSPCPECGTDVERVLPAGTIVSLAKLMRGMALTCTDCSERLDEEEEARKIRMERQGREERCELPPLLRGLSWDGYSVERPGAAAAVDAAREWAAGEHAKRGLLYVGPVGVGKTTLAAIAMWAALDRIGVRYVNVAELAVKMTAAFGDKDRQAALRVLTGRGPVVLDDLDKVNPSMQVLSHLYTAIDGRVQAGTSMIVTTNMDPQALLEKFSKVRQGDDASERRVAAEAIVDRLVGHCSIFRITGGSGRV
jgi:DNA replication protein DnaC